MPFVGCEGCLLLDEKRHLRAVAFWYRQLVERAIAARAKYPRLQFSVHSRPVMQNSLSRCLQYKTAHDGGNAFMTKCHMAARLDSFYAFHRAWPLVMKICLNALLSLMRLLLVEDEIDIQRFLRSHWKSRDSVETGVRRQDRAAGDRGPFDILIVDLGLPMWTVSA